MQIYCPNVLAPLMELGCAAQPPLGCGCWWCPGCSVPGVQPGPALRAVPVPPRLPCGMSQGEVPNAGQSPRRGELFPRGGGFGGGTHRQQAPPSPGVPLRLGACSQDQRPGARRSVVISLKWRKREKFMWGLVPEKMDPTHCPPHAVCTARAGSCSQIPF